MSLVGGDITLSPGSSLTTPAGRVDLVSVGSPGTVRMRGIAADGFREYVNDRLPLVRREREDPIQLVGFSTLGAISLGGTTNTDTISVRGAATGTSGGFILLRAHEVALSGARLNADTPGLAPASSSRVDQYGIDVSSRGSVNIAAAELPDPADPSNTILQRSSLRASVEDTGLQSVGGTIRIESGSIAINSADVTSLSGESSARRGDPGPIDRRCGSRRRQPTRR